VLLRPVHAHRPPPGVALAAWADALAEDTYEVLSGLAVLDAAVICPASERDRAAALVWPGTAIHVLPDSGSRPAGATTALDLLLNAGAQAAIVVSDDVPDLPGLLLGKLFSALEGAVTTASTAGHRTPPDRPAAGGLVALGACAPRPSWMPEISLDAEDALGQLQRAAPAGGLALTPGWRRLRSAADHELLDDGLEGWPATRALLGR